MITLVNALSAVVRRAPAGVVVAALLLTGLLGGLATQVEMAAGNDGFAPDNEELLAAETLNERFGETGQSVMQVLLSTDGDLVTAEGVQAVASVREALLSSPVADDLSEQPNRPAVVSFIDPLFLAAEQQGIDVATLDDQQVKELYSAALEQMPAQEAGFIAALQPDDTAPTEADAALMLVFVDTSSVMGEGDEAFDQQIALEADIAEVVAQAPLPEGVTAEAFSFALLFSDMDEFSAEVGRLFGMAFGIIVLILLFVYWVKPGYGTKVIPGIRRTVADMLLTMATILMAIGWMQGFAYLLGPEGLGVMGRLNQITQVVPVLLIGLGVDYAIHLTSRYREEVGTGSDPTDGMSRAVHTVGVALVLATITTVVGFLTNVVNPVPALRDFGILAAIGITASFILMLTFVPAVRLLLDRRAEQQGRLPRAALNQTGERLLPGIMARTAVLAERFPIPTLLVTVVLGGALGAWGLASLETRFSSTDFLPDDSPIVATYETIVDRFDGGFGEQTDVLLTGDVATVEAHNAMVAATADLTEIEDVSTFEGQAAAESPVSVLAQLVMPGPEGQPAVPELAQQAAAAGLQEDLTFAADGDVPAVYAALLEAAPDQARRVLSENGGEIDMARFSIQTTAGEAGAGPLAEHLDEAFAEVEEAGVDAIATSNPIINHVIITALQDSQVSSLVTTLIAAMLLLVITFAIQARRPFLGVITIGPVALVVLWTFGLMALTDIPFGPVTATIAALAIGIGVPYTIHVTHRYSEDRIRYTDPAEAIRSTVRHTGGALAGSAFTTVAGFGILITSSLTPFRQFGMVTAYAIGFAVVAATIVLPSMLALWDSWHRRRGTAAVEVLPPGAEATEPAPAEV